jgi:hypothetical protein
LFVQPKWLSLSLYGKSLTCQGERPIEKVTVRMMMPLNATNIDGGIADGAWKLLPGTFGEGTICLEIVNQFTLAPDVSFAVNPLHISTNCNPKLFTAKVYVFTSGMSGIENYVVNFTLP